MISMCSWVQYHDIVSIVSNYDLSFYCELTIRRNWENQKKKNGFFFSWCDVYCIENNTFRTYSYKKKKLCIEMSFGCWQCNWIANTSRLTLLTTEAFDVDVWNCCFGRVELEWDVDFSQTFAIFSVNLRDFSAFYSRFQVYFIESTWW